MKTCEWLVPALVAILATVAHASPPGGVLRGKIVDGTTGGPGHAQRVALIEMQSGKKTIAALDDVSRSFVLEDLPIAGETPYLLQATAAGVNYNQPVSFGGGYEAEATVTVYSVTTEWKNLEISRARFVFRREGDALRVDKLFVVENQTEPQETYFHPEGTFKFHLPVDLRELISVSAATPGEKPVAQLAQPTADGSGHIARIALKPGTTQIGISYRVDYDEESYTFRDETYYPVSDFMALVAPLDVKVEAAGLASMGSDPQNRFLIFGKTNLPAGAPIEIQLSGANRSGVGTQDVMSRLRAFPDPSRGQKWIIVLLMASALTYGVLFSLGPRRAGAARPGMKAAHRKSERGVPRRRSTNRSLGQK